MLRFLLAFFALVFFANGSASAQNKPEDILEKICDQAAASPDDSSRPMRLAGTSFNKIDGNIAVPACEAAVKANPNNPRLAFQLGRAHAAAGAHHSARIHYEMADEAGFDLATNNLAGLYEHVAKDFEKAVRLYEKAANRGLARAMLSLAEYYTNVPPPRQDYVAARKWAKAATDAGNVDATYLYAEMLFQGRGGQKNQSEAIRWYTRAAELGHSNAMWQLGISHHYGDGVVKNIALARSWYLKAIAAGNVGAMDSYGFMLWMGEGGAVNRKEALLWFAKAAAGGSEHALENLMKVSRQIPASQNSQGQSQQNNSGWQQRCPPGYVDYGATCVLPCSIGQYRTC